MLITLLRADRPLTKTLIKQADGTWDTEPYPNVKYFSSTNIEIPDPDTLFHILKEAATHSDCCLLKGVIDTPLVNEPRAGRTTASEPTSYLVLDLDFSVGFESVDAFMEAIGLKDVTYSFQHSASAGWKYAPGLRGHVFVMLSRAVSPPILKEWLRWLNLTVPALRNQITLNSTGLGLKWPLDLTTCQNDKLIYLAKATVTNEQGDPLNDPVGQRWSFHSKNIDPWLFDTPPLNAEQLRQQEADIMARLRNDLGLPTKKASIKTVDGRDLVLMNPDEVLITGQKVNGDFIYFNLNGGDSWGYYALRDNPKFIDNFKGEPLMLLNKIAPAVYSTLKQQIAEFIPQDLPVAWGIRIKGKDRFAVVSLVDEYLILDETSSLEKLNGILSLDFGLPKVEDVPTWSVEFNPTALTPVNVKEKTLNTFRPTSFMLMDDTATEIPPTIDMIIRNICGDDEAMIDHFINWCAVIFKHRIKTQTAWIFQGIPGTGKNTFSNYVMAPLLGAKHVQTMVLDMLGGTFNGYMEECLLLVVDEVKAEKSDIKLVEKMKNLVTEPHQSIMYKGVDAVMKPSFSNVLFFSNNAYPWPIDRADRRYNVAPYVTKKLDAWDPATLAAELPQFAAYLRGYEESIERARKPLDTAARREAQEATRDQTGELLEELVNGNLDYFAERIVHPDEWMKRTPDPEHEEYRLLITQWAKDAAQSKLTIVPPSHLDIVLARFNGYDARKEGFRRMALKKDGIGRKGPRIFYECKKVSGRAVWGIPVYFKLEEPGLLPTTLHAVAPHPLKKAHA